MSALRQKQKELLRLLDDLYGIKLSRSKLDRYLFSYSKLIPNNESTMSACLDELILHPEFFAFFIFGYNACKYHYRINKLQNNFSLRDILDNKLYEINNG